MVTTWERAAQIIAETCTKCKGLASAELAARILDALLRARIMPTTMRASADMFTRFHAHCRFLGTATGEGYEEWYNKAVAYAVEQDDWPVKLIAKTLSIDGHDITVDVQVPQSTTRANNRQLLTAYTVITEGAKEHGVALPEHPEIGYE